MKNVHTFKFRWPVKPIAPDEVEMTVPRGPGQPILNIEFVKIMGLSDGEIDAAENAVIRKVAIIE